MPHTKYQFVSSVIVQVLDKQTKRNRGVVDPESSNGGGGGGGAGPVKLQIVMYHSEPDCIC